MIDWQDFVSEVLGTALLFVAATTYGPFWFEGVVPLWSAKARTWEPGPLAPAVDSQSGWTSSSLKCGLAPVVVAGVRGCFGAQSFER